MSMEWCDSRHEKLKFSAQARFQQKERNITDDAVASVILYGKESVFRYTKVYTDQNYKIKVSKDNNTIITVDKNKRNIRFQLSEHIKEEEEHLLYEANIKNNIYAMCELGELYLDGKLGERNIGKAYNLFKRAAEAGNSHGMSKISELYESGELGTPNQELADKWMKKAADRNNVFALACIGQKLLMKYKEKYPAGSNIFRPSAQKKEILYYLNKASDKGSTRATWQLGEIYEKGLLGNKDLSKAIKFYVQAAKLGSPASLNSLHQLTLECIFPLNELEEILDHVSSFLPTTSIGMALQLGRDQLNGDLGYNPIRGLKLVEHVALKQYDKAILQLAICYREGIGCDVNLKLAQYWFIQLHKLYDVSAEGGNVSSLWKLGESYFSGHSNKIDLEKAELCFRRAIEKSSNPDWNYFLGKCYLNGQLGDKPVDIGYEYIAQAIKIWKLRAESGNSKVCYDLGYVYFYINNHKEAVYWLSKAPDDYVKAQLLLAKIYLDNLSQEKNVSLGLGILERVILEHGCSPSNAFENVDIFIDDHTLRWLQGIADNIATPVSDKNLTQYRFQEFVVTTLAETYETDKLGEINYDLASKYYNQLFVNWKDIEAGNELIQIYIDQHLPTEYNNTVKNWVLEIPVKFETGKIEFHEFIDCVLLLGKIYQMDDLLPRNIQEAAKWLYLALYYYQNNRKMIKEIECDLEKLPVLDHCEKIQLVSELTKLVKVTSLANYKVLTRVLGDIFYDGKIVNQNIDESIYWYTESANKNNILASFKLAKIYQNDKQDITTSIKWYKLSAQIGNKEALKALMQIADEPEHNSLLSFISNYQHQSMVEESELVNIKPFKNLDSYPKTMRQMYELGKSYLNSGGDHNILNAAYWFREAKSYMDAAFELYSMYESGILGINVIPCAEILYIDILKECYSELKESSVSEYQDDSSTLLLLNRALKISNIINAITLNKKIETLIDQIQNINIEILAEIISELETIIIKVNSQIKIYHDLDAFLLAEDISSKELIV